MDEFDRLEALLRDAGRDLAYPPTPDLSQWVRRKASGSPNLPLVTRRWALSLLLLAGLVMGLLSAPPVRAQILEFINLGALRIFLTDPTNQAPVSPTTGPGGSPLNLPDLSGETTFEQAEELAGFGLKFPAALERPDRVYFQEIGGPVVVMLWLAEDPSGGVRYSLTHLGPGAFAGKDSPATITETNVGSFRALWLEGSHSFFIVEGEMELVRLVVDGNVLLWEQEGITYRLESQLDLVSARRLAESLR